MNVSDCTDFKKEGNFLDIVDNWRNYDGIKATYMIALSCAIPRLMGTSDILYIGQSKDLGIENSGRLWNYKNAQSGSNDWRIKNYTQRLIARGHAVSFYICQTPPNGMSVKEYEKCLLSRFRKEHWELTPWNFKVG